MVLQSLFLYVFVALSIVFFMIASNSNFSFIKKKVKSSSSSIKNSSKLSKKSGKRKSSKSSSRSWENRLKNS